MPIKVWSETKPNTIDAKNKVDKKYVFDNKFNIYFMNLAVIILAAGNSTRFRSNIPKQFHFYKKDILINHSISKKIQLNYKKN